MKPFERIKPGATVTILVPNGLNIARAVIYAERKGRAVFYRDNGWILNMGDGTPGIATAENTVAVRNARNT